MQQKPDAMADPGRQEQRELTARWIDTTVRPDLYPPPAQNERPAGGAPIQMRGGPTHRAGEVQQIASHGLTGAATSLPHLDRIQQSFGHHDVSGTQAHIGGAAATASEATGGIGGMVATTIGQMVAEGVAKLVQEHVKSVISSQLDTLVEQAYTRFPDSSGGPSRGPFLESQLQALNDAAQVAGDALDDRRNDFYSAEDGAEQSLALADAYDAQNQAAYDRQYLASTAEWSRLVDGSQHFTNRDHLRMDTTAEGILGIDIDLTDDDPGADIQVTGAHLDGVPEGVRNRLRTLRGLKIQDLCTQDSGMTIRVIQEYSGGYFFGTIGETRTRIAMESRPGARNQLMPAVTGTEGMYVLERGRRRYDIPIREQDYNMVPVVAAIVWAHEINPIRLMDLPAIEG